MQHQQFRAVPHLLPNSFGFALQQILPISAGSSPNRVWSEALIRPGASRNPKGPAAFIENLYECLPVASVDEMVVNRLTSWQLAQTEPNDLSINTHPQSLVDDSFVSLVTTMAAVIKPGGHSICLELVEYGHCTNKATLVDNAIRLRRAGVLIALDDFGSRLNCFDLCGAGIVDFIKIDIGVTRELLTNKNQRAVVRGIVKMAEGLQSQVIAEGVEERGQLDVLRSLGVDYAQGYWLHRPALMEEI